MFRELQSYKVNSVEATNSLSDNSETATDDKPKKKVKKHNIICSAMNTLL